MFKKRILSLLLALPLALMAAPELKFQAFNESFVKLEDFKSGTWKITIEINNKNLHFSYTGRVKASDGPSSDLRVSLEDIDFTVGYWDTPTMVNGEEHHFAMAEIVALWEDAPLVFSEGSFTILPPWSQERAANQSLAEGKKLTGALIKKTPAIRWSRAYGKEIDRAFDDIWIKQEILERKKALKEDAIAAAAAKAEAERNAKLEAEKEKKLAEQREQDRLDKEKEERAQAKAARAKKKRAARAEVASESVAETIPDPEEVAEEAVDGAEYYEAAVSASSHLVSNDRLRNNITWTTLAIGAVTMVVGIIEHRNTMASKWLYDQHVVLNPSAFPGDPNSLMAEAYDRIKRDHEMNRNIAVALSVISLGASFVIYKF